MIKSETNNGRFNDVIGLYLNLLNEIDNSSLPQELNQSIEMLKISSNPDLYPDNSFANIISLVEGKTWDFNLISKEINLSTPIVVRLAGTNVKQGKEILDKSDLKILSASDLNDAAKKVVEAIK